MTNIALTTRNICAAIVKKFRTGVTLTSNLIVPGQIVSTSAFTDWCELTFDGFSRKPQRKLNQEIKPVKFCVRIVVKDNYRSAGRRAVYRISSLRAHVSSVFNQSIIPVLDYDTVGSPEIGKIIVYEPSVDVLTGKARQELPTWTQVSDVQFIACAHEK